MAHPAAEKDMTFSIAAFDRTTGDLAIGVASRFLAVGAVVPYVRAGVGAVATQAYANTRWGPRGLELLATGSDPEAAIAQLQAEDVEPEVVIRRQVGIVDARGRAASYSGADCTEWAGSQVGQHYACQGNILSGPEVVAAISDGFERAAGDLATRVLAALCAGQAAGGDRRGQQSAALLVAREGAGFRGGNDRYVDVRVDDHPQPLEELSRLLELWRVTFLTPP
jgi:uncharacterized Ntn-hydrolase superfamily protein